MGIPGLLPKLKSITDDIHISEYAGLTVAVDALCWYPSECLFIDASDFVILFLGCIEVCFAVLRSWLLAS